MGVVGQILVVKVAADERAAAAEAQLADTLSAAEARQIIIHYNNNDNNNNDNSNNDNSNSK